MKENSLRSLFPPSRRTLIALLLVMGAGYFLMSDLMGGTFWVHQKWDSYTLQTYGWLHGRMHVENPENYAYLELAIFNGQYYVSFPPLPSVVLIPFVMIWGMNTPNNIIIAVYGLIAAALAYEIMLHRGRSPRTAAFWALVCVWGCNMLWMTTIAGVWFQAQALNMVMCLAAVLCAIKGKKALSTTFLALAVGCRPLSAVFLPVFAILFAWNEREQHGGFIKNCLRQWKCLIGPILIAACYMAYNYARFGLPLEFGHNFLPEHTRSELGQFHINYLWPNLKRLLFEPITIKDGRLDFTLFDGFVFYLANPLFLIYFFRCAISAGERGVSAEGVLLALGLLAQLLLTCMHSTLGAWQFGARYTCDLLPFVYMYLADRGKKEVSNWELAIGGLAVAFNAYGVMFMHLYG